MRHFDGAITAEHLANGKEKSAATTQLVSKITLSNGRTIQYEYDAVERITKVVIVFLNNPKGAIEFSMAPDGFYGVLKVFNVVL